VAGCAFDAVIFDLDGVLLDSEPIYLRATNSVLAREGRYLSPEVNAGYIGWRYAEFIRDIIQRLELAHPPEHYAEETRAAAERLFSGPLEPPPGAVDLIDRLAAAGVPLAVGSSSSHAWVDRILRGLGVRERFPVIVGGDEVASGKPAPDIFLRCAELLTVEPSRCAVIEDSPPGVLAARRAGMTAIGLRTAATAGLVLEGCLAIVDGLADCAPHLGLEP
jgi:HAD superfamily hydrolase (TIGR01509 family)